MVRKTAKYKKDKYLKILDKASVVVGAVVLILGMVRKLISYKKK